MRVNRVEEVSYTDCDQKLCLLSDLKTRSTEGLLREKVQVDTALGIESSECQVILTLVSIDLTFT